MKTAFICSPYRGDVKANTAKALGYCQQALAQGYMPYAPHLYFTRFLGEDDPVQRNAGINAGVEWLARCDEVWVFGEPTEGMRIEMARAEKSGKKVVFRDA